MAVASAVPTFLRARALHGTLDEAFGAFALAALLTFLPALLVLGAVRKGRDGVRALAGDLSVAGVGMAVGASVLVLAFWERLGAFLAHATHHRGLGGVAFAAGGLILALAVSLVTRRAWPAVEAQGAARAVKSSPVLGIAEVADLEHREGVGGVDLVVHRRPSRCAGKQ